MKENEILKIHIGKMEQCLSNQKRKKRQLCDEISQQANKIRNHINSAIIPPISMSIVNYLLNLMFQTL